MPRFRRSKALIVGVVLVVFCGLTSVDYTVTRGDTLGQIARDHDVSLSDLVEANDISNPNLIYPGQVLVIPGETTDIIHVVARGETLAKIAFTYGSSVTEIAAANSLPNPDLIRVGQELLVPAVSGADPGDGSGSSDESSSEDTPKSLRSGKYHVVKRGESLKSIASQYSGVSPDAIATANGIINGRIYTGTRLFLDGPGFTARGTEGEITYTIRRGDRLGDIAHEYDVSVSTLISRNNISNPNLIRSGDTLVIPSGVSWVCPVEDPSYFNDWGFPRGGGTRYHEGNDLFVAKGTPVRAPVSGRVEFVTGTIGGLQFRLFGEDGIKYIGSHMSAFGKDGEVRAGDVIGYVGNTGNASKTRPHLHFGIYYKGLAVNPYPSLVTHGC
ncbi:MAG: LysM peptidoglycan-binding domain-containing M23 family metallopeptidase [Acidimicrobiia bacterium]|jgi:LysM repeat protein